MLEEVERMISSVILSWGRLCASRGHLATSGDSLVFITVAVLLASSGERPRMVLYHPKMHRAPLH